MELPKLREFLDAFDVPWPVAGGIAVGSAAILYFHDAGWKHFRGLPDWSITLLAVLTVYGNVVVLMKMLKAMGAWNKRRTRTIAHYRRINEYLDTLSPEERGVFTHLLQNNQRSFTTQLTDAAIATLIQKGLVVRAEGAHSILEWPHTIPEDVWSHVIIRRREFLGERDR